MSDRAALLNEIKLTSAALSANLALPRPGDIFKAQKIVARSFTLTTQLVRLLADLATMETP